MTFCRPALWATLLAILPTAALAIDEQSCVALNTSTLADEAVEISQASWATDRTVNLGGPGSTATTAPAHCHVTGIIDRRSGVDDVEYGIGFELNLPEDWNGRFLFQGGGGLNGTVNAALGAQASGDTPALMRGFAVASTDSGHQGAGFDASFMDDQVAALNFYYLANARVTDVSRDILATFYGEPAQYDYFLGCSTGGREAMIMSQRFPDYYDGIVAGAPAMRTGLSNLADRWVAVHINQVADLDEQGRPVPGSAFSVEQQQFVVDGLLEACDALDGREDKLIFNTRACAANFDPHQLSCENNDHALCLSDAQAEALVTGFAGPVDSRGIQLYPGFLFDPGINDSYGLPGLIAGSANPVGVANATLLEQDVDAEYQAAIAQGAALGDSSWLNLSTFSAQGGKLMFYHGNADPWFSALDTLRYYEDMAAVNGGLETVSTWSRAFLVPGMGHCQGGDDTLDRFDMLSAIVGWVEEAEVPASIEASGPSMPDVTRPLCPWPSYAHYSGQGDPADAGSYDCKTAAP